MLANKNLTKFINLFLPNDFKKNDDIILNYFKKWLNSSTKSNSVEHSSHKTSNMYPYLNAFH